MEIRLSEESIRYIESQISERGYGSVSEFLEQLLTTLRRREKASPTERRDWMRLQEEAAAAIWDNEADARYDAL